MPPVKPKEPPVKRKKYSDDDMHKAILAFRNGCSIAGAARQYGVPRVTLMDKLSGRTPEMCKMGRRPVLGEEEESVLVKWIFTCKSAGFPVSTDQLIHSTQQMLKKLGKEDVFTKGAPTRRWVEGFLKRHPELSLRESQNLTSSRANVTVEKIEQWFDEVKSYLQNNNFLDILKDPSRVFNCDETAFFLSPEKGKVIVGRGDKTVYRVTGSDKENVTVLLNCSADGKLVPCGIVFPYVKWPPKVIASIPDEWGAGKTENGWMTSQSFYEYIGNVFEPYLAKHNIKRPVILYMDGHSSHMSLEVSELCSQKNIILVALYPNATHILQPLDVAVFHPLKAAWRRAVTTWRFQNDGRKLERKDFAPLLKKVLDSDAVKADTIKNGFKTCGLLSLDSKEANLTKVLGQAQKQTPAKSNANILTLQRHFYFLESRIDPETLTSFWNEEISVEDKSLFVLWKGLKTEIANLKNSDKKEQAQHQDQPEGIINPQTTPPPPFSAAVIEEDQEEGTIVEEAVVVDEAFLDHEEALLETIPPNTTEDDSPPLSFASSDIGIQQMINAALPSCSWDTPVLLLEDVEIETSVTCSTPPPSQKDVQVETPSRGILDFASEILITIPPITPETSTTPPTVVPNSSNNAPTDIPSPFKDCLLWPRKVTKSSNGKRKKTRTPAVVTSKLWKDFHKKLEEEKTKKELAVAQRKLLREERIKIKKEKEENKAKRKLQPVCKNTTKKPKLWRMTVKKKKKKK